ncbi:MAG: sensor histidine kinase [Chloroflexi bacterium]|nr:MAG: sensor histidine kinase [Chloroflexota bacterium]
MLQEIHHRVKNNLQIVASLLSLQSQFLAYPAALDALAESQTRVRSMAMIHEQLYRSGNLAQLDFADYVSTLSRQVLRSYRGKVGAVNLQISVDNVSLPLDTAIPCGLLITEILSNAVKHAFPDFRSGQICINFCRCDGDNFQLTITDDGAGFPAELAGCLMKNGLTGPCVQSLGLQLIDSLTHQLDGKIRFDSQPGATVFEITFPAGEEFYPAETTTPNMMQA